MNRQTGSSVSSKSSPRRAGNRRPMDRRRGRM